MSVDSGGGTRVRQEENVDLSEYRVGRGDVELMMRPYRGQKRGYVRHYVTILRDVEVIVFPSILRDVEGRKGFKDPV